MYIGIHKTGVPIGIEDIDGDMLKIKGRTFRFGDSSYSKELWKRMF
jgi:hypothetical protein